MYHIFYVRAFLRCYTISLQGPFCLSYSANRTNRSVFSVEWSTYLFFRPCQICKEAGKGGWPEGVAGDDAPVSHPGLACHWHVCIVSTHARLFT